MSSNSIFYLAVVLVLCASAQARCPDKYEFLGEKCLKGVNTTKLTWMKAQRYCARDGGYLVNILSQKDQAVTHIINRELGKDCPTSWIGALVYKSNAYFFNRAPPPSFDTDTWFYPTPNLNAYTNWYRGRPNNLDNAQRCGVQYGNDGSWNDDKCYLESCFICETDVFSRIQIL